MSKFSILIFSVFLLTGCYAHNENYFRQHPGELKAAMERCPNQQPAQISCDEMATLAAGINQLAYDMQVDPQGFGKRIISLQEELVKQETALTTTPAQPTLKKNIQQNKQQLAEYLAIVKWLQSPGR